MKRIDARTSLDPVRDFLAVRAAAQRDVSTQVAEIGKFVRAEGWQALSDLTSRFDGISKPPLPDSFRVTAEEFDAAQGTMADDLREAVLFAIDRIRRFHEKQKRGDWFHDEPGIRTGQLFRPLERVGVYAPGGAAVLFSTLIMNVIPAQVAGCPSITVCSPPQKATGSVDPLILATSGLLGLTAESVWAIGGSQAIFAMAYDLPEFPRVDGVFGPGNAYVMEAKRHIQGEVRIESLPGNSEILVIADGNANPKFVAADLLSQAEHAGGEMSILVTPSASLLESVDQEVVRQLATMERRAIASDSLATGGLLVLARDLDQACEIANLVAAEHLEIQTEDAESYLPKIRHAGAIFVGPWASEPIGDYTAGTNHVLPTGGAARFSSALSVDDFMKKISVVQVEAEGIRKIGPPAMRIAEAEGLFGHKSAIALRLAKLD